MTRISVLRKTCTNADVISTAKQPHNVAAKYSATCSEIAYLSDNTRIVKVTAARATTNKSGFTVREKTENAIGTRKHTEFAKVEYFFVFSIGCVFCNYKY